MKSPVLVPIIFFCLFLGSCGSLKKIVEPPIIKLDEVKVLNLSAISADLAVVLDVQNTNAIDFDVKSLKYSLDVDDKVVTSGIMNEKVVVKAKDKTAVSIPIRILYKDIIKSAFLLLKEEGLPYRIQGSAEVGPFTIPFDDRGNLKTSDL